MPINTQKYRQNEAWLLFRLNDDPVCTKLDGDFNVLAIMDVATGLILGMGFIRALAEEPSEFESRKLFASSESKAGVRPQYLLVDSDHNLAQLIRAATAMGVEVIPESGKNLNAITQEAREGFAAHALGRGRQ